MKTTLRMTTTAIKTIAFLLAMNLIFSCSNNKDNNANTITTSKKSADTTIITGAVKTVVFGKDGYTADVLTDKEGTYAALVSISNVGGPDNYKSCDVGDKVTLEGILSVLDNVRQLRVTKIMGITPTQTKLLISPISFRGIQVGDLIATHKEYIKKTKLETGEGNFEVYEIKDFENNPAGYILPDPNNKLLVGHITVTTPKAQTAKGIKVGDTFRDLLKTFPDIEVHGSEIEGQTHANALNLSYRLDMYENSYKIDKAKIPDTTKITEIRINSGATAKAMIQEEKYSKVKPDEYCWQTNKVMNLHTDPNTKSKVEGKHFAGEVLKVLGTKVVDNQLWIKVNYTFSIKAGYESTFADGQVHPTGGLPTGWIGGAVTPTINCK